MPHPLLQVSEEQAQRQYLRLQGRLPAVLDQRLQLRLGLAASALLQLQQSHQLQSLDSVGAEVEQLAQLPLSRRAIVVLAMQFRQQQSQLPAPGLLIGQLLQQRRCFL